VRSRADPTFEATGSTRLRVESRRSGSILPQLPGTPKTHRFKITVTIAHPARGQRHDEHSTSKGAPECTPIFS
jgi:hypothetical protein